MDTYDLIAIGSGSSMNIVEPYLHNYPNARVAVIDKDEPGGICLTRGCIPSKILLYPAEVARTIREARGLGIEAKIEKIHFRSIMERMRLLITLDIMQIGEALKAAKNIDYFRAQARFVEPHVLSVEGRRIRGKTILLGTGSKPTIPHIEGLQEAGYHTSDSLLNMNELPPSWAIIGGGYIAAEYGAFLQAMGAEVTVIGRNPRYLKQEEPEVSALALREARQRMTVYTAAEVVKVETTTKARRRLRLEQRTSHVRGDAAAGRHSLSGQHGGSDASFSQRPSAHDASSSYETPSPPAPAELEVDHILVAAGRSSTAELLDPEKGGIETTPDGWIEVDSQMRTSSDRVWAFGDATGSHLFKHVANHESGIVYMNAVQGQDPPAKANYLAVPHAVFTQPEIAAVGLGERDAVETFGEEDVAVGFSLFEETAKGKAMDLQEKGYFVKVLIHRSTGAVLGASIIGPQASVLIHEIIIAMNTESRRFPLSALHIHPALSEVVANAVGSLMSVEEYHHRLSHHFGTTDHGEHGH